MADDLLECWIFWLLHAHEYEAERLLNCFRSRRSARNGEPSA